LVHSLIDSGPLGCSGGLPVIQLKRVGGDGGNMGGGR
jgi:hypothetical protein